MEYVFLPAMSWRFAPVCPSQILISESTMPPLVATASLSEKEVNNLRSAFQRAHEEPALSASLKAILVERFVVPELAAYDETRRRAERVEEAPEWP